jgi:2-keto-4-pentenoate hydratase/2-oxohepta-3-ene-1,7-dioic acid hydratase in catechol pathway
MKLARFDAGQGPRPGLVRVDGIVDLQEQPGGFDSIAAVVAGGEAALERVRQMDMSELVTHQIAEVQLLAPIERVGEFLAIGMNFRKHLAEAERIGGPARK